MRQKVPEEQCGEQFALLILSNTSEKFFTFQVYTHFKFSQSVEVKALAIFGLIYIYRCKRLYSDNEPKKSRILAISISRFAEVSHIF